MKLKADESFERPTTEPSYYTIGKYWDDNTATTMYELKIHSQIVGSSSYLKGGILTKPVKVYSSGEPRWFTTIKAQGDKKWATAIAEHYGLKIE